jgi:competence protein ComGC
MSYNRLRPTVRGHKRVVSGSRRSHGQGVATEFASGFCPLACGGRILKPSSKMYFESRRLRRKSFTLVEIMIVVATIALLAAMALPGFLRARKRSLAVRIRNDLRLIDSAVEQYAIESGKRSGAPVAVPGLD